jgi:hypothetical protein
MDIKSYYPGNQIYKNWDVRKMETDSAKGKKSERQVSETTQKIMQAAALNKEGILFLIYRYIYFEVLPQHKLNDRFFVSVVLQYLGV